MEQHFTAYSIRDTKIDFYLLFFVFITGESSETESTCTDSENPITDIEGSSEESVSAHEAVLAIENLATKTDGKSLLELTHESLYPSSTIMHEDTKLGISDRLDRIDLENHKKDVYDPGKVMTEKSHLNNNETEKNLVKPKPILVFDVYGNLTIVDDKEPEEPPDPFDSIVPEDFMKGPLSVENEPVPMKKNKIKTVKDHQASNPVVNNGSMKKRKTKSLENPNVETEVYTDKELKQAFKTEFNTGATSRYGRARKRKTEDGFLFGTLNFNELRRITGNSPKKSKLMGAKMSSPDEKNMDTKSASDTEEEPSETFVEEKTYEEPITSSSPEPSDDSDFQENTKKFRTPKKFKAKKYQKKTPSPKKKQKDDDETWTIRQNNKNKTSKTPDSSLIENNEKSPKSRSLRSTEKVSPSKQSSLDRSTRSNRRSTLSSDVEGNDLKSDEIAIKEETLEIKDELNEESGNSIKSEIVSPRSERSKRRDSKVKTPVKIKNEIKKETEEVFNTPNRTTKSGRESKKFVPIDISLEEKKQKEKKLKENQDQLNKSVGEKVSRIEIIYFKTSVLLNILWI